MTDVAAAQSTALTQPLAYEGVDANRLALIKDKVSRGYNALVPRDPELAGFLELAAKYDLDPFADEIWLSKSKGRNGGEGQLLIMVGRNGLRKIARRAGLDLDADAVREKDEFKVIRTADRQRRIEHVYHGGAEERGPVIGAWAECYDLKTGVTKGFNYAPLHEYKPDGKKLEYSPWGSAESIMIITAAERNALRQATPLGGLIAESDTAVVNGDVGGGPVVNMTWEDALRDVVMELDVSLDLRERLLAAVVHANEQSPNAYGVAKAQMTFPGRTESELEKELVFIHQTFGEPMHVAERGPDVKERQLAEEEDIPDADVVPEEHPEDEDLTKEF